MPNLKCVACGEAFEIPGLAHPSADRDPWIICPHCQAKNVDPAALVEPPSHREWLALLGMLLILIGLFGGVCGTFAVEFHESMFKNRESGGLRTLASIVGFVALIATGVLLIWMGTRYPRHSARAGKVLVAILFSLGVTLAGLIYAFAGCMQK